MRTKAEMMAELQTMLRDVLAAAAAGTSQARIARAHGYVDGYMRALLDLGVADRVELIQLVAAEREHASGPAVRVLEPSSDEIAAA
ncbi:MAG TPA: hypothetical protein VIF15_01025 [Polyangiaceae bacterium]|jgi:hypothetical protein